MSENKLNRKREGERIIMGERKREREREREEEEEVEEQEKEERKKGMKE